MIKPVEPYLVKLIKGAAVQHKLSPALIAAICQKESSFNPDAMRYEQNYRWFCKVAENAERLKITSKTEETLQAFSYGLMQLMGANARNQGFWAPLPVLLDPETNLKYGCAHLRGLYTLFDPVLPSTEWSDRVIAAYNAGSPRRAKGSDMIWVNETYVRDVEKFYREFLTLRWG